MVELIFLGTSSMVPTKERNHSSVYLKHNETSLLFDCGEGTQRQMRFIGIKPSKIKMILITHWHGDHVLGLPGILQTISASVSPIDDKPYEKKTIKIFGPIETKKRIKYMLKAFSFNNIINLEIKEIKKDGIFYENEDILLEAAYLKHSVPCIGYSFHVKDKLSIDKTKLKSKGINDGPYLKELKKGKNIIIKNQKYNYKDLTKVKKGKKITYAVDTIVCDNLIKLAKNSDLLITEATYEKEHQNLAEKNYHMTSIDAASVASESNVKKLIITHFSQRYKSVDRLLQQTKDIFPNTISAYDFLKIRI